MIGETITDTLLNTLHKFLTIAILAVYIFFSGLTVDFVGAQNTAAGPAASRRPADLLQSRYLRFGRLTTEDGLSNDSVWGIAQDSYGFMWFGTFEGLNRYDGKSVKVFRNDPADPSSLSHNAVYMVYEDHAGMLWFGTWGGGLNQFDRKTETFTHYQYNSADPYGLGNDNVYQIYEDQAGMFWIATDGGGVNILDFGGKPFRHYRPIPGDPGSFLRTFVRCTARIGRRTRHGQDEWRRVHRQTPKG